MTNIQIRFNGTPQIITSHSLPVFLQKHNIDVSFVAVAINNQVIPASVIHTTQLQDGDALEVVHAICGG